MDRNELQFDRVPGPSESVTRESLAAMRQGDAQASQRFFERWFPRLTRFLRLRLQRRPSRTADEEDLAVEVLDAVLQQAATCKGLASDTSSAVWRVLRAQGQHHLERLRRYDQRLKRNAARTAICDPHDLNRLPARDIGAAQRIEIRDDFDAFLRSLRDDTLRKIINLRLEGHAIGDIARTVGYCERSVRRKLTLIYDTWLAQQAGRSASELAPPPPHESRRREEAIVATRRVERASGIRMPVRRRESAPAQRASAIGPTR